MTSWAGELKDFDQAATHELLVRTVGDVPTSVRLVLDLVGDGVKLTPGGRLPRVFVRQVAQLRPEWNRFGGPVNAEEDLFPLFRLHHVLRDAGLLRMSKGVLRPTKAAADDLDVIRRLRRWFAEDLFLELLTGDDDRTVAAGPSATTLLPRATALAVLLV